jgi:FkbM family methyltransferase
VKAFRLRRMLRRFGVDVVRYDERRSSDLRRLYLLSRYGVEVVLDVGANDGSYAAGLRAFGFRGRIVSFEPQAAAYERLAHRALSDPLWECRPVAVGAAAGVVALNISANSSSSSLLEMESRHVAAAPTSRYVAKEQATMISLDESQLLEPGERALLTADVQGFELEVLRGSERTLEQVELVEVELSLVPLYAGAPLLPEVYEHLRERGFALVGLEPVLLDPAGAVLQLDGLFARSA